MYIFFNTYTYHTYVLHVDIFIETPSLDAFYCCSQITVGYALIAVINGVFLKETFSAAENDDKIMMRHLVFQIAAGVGQNDLC